MMRALAIALASLALVACGPSSVYHGASSYSPNERAIIEAASLAMSDRTDAERLLFVWDDGDDDDNRILRASPPDPDASGEFMMSSRSYARTIYLDPSLTGDALAHVAEHEFGHAAGLGHLEKGVVGLMNPDISSPWGAADLEACRKVGRCS